MRPKPRVTLNDVARLAGVSVSVASRELNGDPALRAREETRARIRDAAQVLDYTPNHAARALRLSKAAAIGLIVPDLTNAIFAELMHGIEDAADALGYQVLIGRTERLQPGSDFLRRLVGEGRVDGFLIQRRDDVDVHEFEEIIKGSAPFVLVNSRGSRRGSVVVDDAGAAALATRHLIELGHRDIALIGGDPRSYTGRQRERGFTRAMAAAGVRRRSGWVLHHGYAPEAGRQSIHELCEAGSRRPTGVVVSNMNAAVGVLLGAREVGLTVPDQLSVVAIHDTWVAEFTWPSLTTVRMPQYQLGQEAVRVLNLRLLGDTAVDSVVDDPPPVLCVRGSTAPPRRPRRQVGSAGT